MRRAWQRVAASAWVRPFLLVALLLVLWDLAIRLFRIPPYLVPPPRTVVKQLVAEWPRLLSRELADHVRDARRLRAVDRLRHPDRDV